MEVTLLIHTLRGKSYVQAIQTFSCSSTSNSYERSITTAIFHALDSFDRCCTLKNVYRVFTINCQPILRNVFIYYCAVLKRFWVIYAWRLLLHHMIVCNSSNRAEMNTADGRISNAESQVHRAFSYGYPVSFRSSNAQVFHKRVIALLTAG